MHCSMLNCILAISGCIAYCLVDDGILLDMLCLPAPYSFCFGQGGRELILNAHDRTIHRSELISSWVAEQLGPIRPDFTRPTWALNPTDMCQRQWQKLVSPARRVSLQSSTSFSRSMLSSQWEYRRLSGYSARGAVVTVSGGVAVYCEGLVNEGLGPYDLPDIHYIPQENFAIVNSFILKHIPTYNWQFTEVITGSWHW